MMLSIFSYVCWQSLELSHLGLLPEVSPGQLHILLTLSLLRWTGLPARLSFVVSSAFPGLGLPVSCQPPFPQPDLPPGSPILPGRGLPPRHEPPLLDPPTSPTRLHWGLRLQRFQDSVQKSAAGLILECADCSFRGGNRCKALFYLKEVLHEVLLQRWQLKAPAWGQSGCVTMPLHELLGPSPTCTPVPAAVGWGPGLAALLNPLKPPPRRQESRDSNKLQWDWVKNCEWNSCLRLLVLTAADGGGVAMGILSIVQL
nr:uncharacterized protein LOC109729432 [Microcebus murinus]